MPIQFNPCAPCCQPTEVPVTGCCTGVRQAPDNLVVGLSSDIPGICSINGSLCTFTTYLNTSITISKSASGTWDGAGVIFACGLEVLQIVINMQCELISGNYKWQLVVALKRSDRAYSFCEWYFNNLDPTDCNPVLLPFGFATSAYHRPGSDCCLNPDGSLAYTLSAAVTE